MCRVLHFRLARDSQLIQPSSHNHLYYMDSENCAQNNNNNNNSKHIFMKK